MNNTAVIETKPVYRIRVIIARQYGPEFERNAWVAKNDGAGTWDGVWYTENEVSQVKYWKTRAGAERWIAARPGVADMRATVEPVRPEDVNSYTSLVRGVEVR